MSKGAAILKVGLVVLMVAGFAAISVYGIDNMKSQSDVVEVKDYTNDFESTQSAIAQINQKLETFESEAAQINQKLEIFESETVKELEEIKIEIGEKAIKVKQEPQQIVLPFEITTNKQVFLKNDSVVILIDNVLPQSSIKIDLLSTSNEIIKTRNVISDLTGSVNTIFQLPSFISEGNYTIQVTYNDSVDRSFITVIEQDESNSESSQSNILDTTKTIKSGITMILDKEQYGPGDIIYVSGVGPASSSVDLKITDPATKSMTSHSNSSDDGTYSIIYILPSDAETGNWKINLTVGDEKSETIVKVIA